MRVFFFGASFQAVSWSYDLIVQYMVGFEWMFTSEAISQCQCKYGGFIG